jgi:hypothetical protein
MTEDNVDDAKAGETTGVQPESLTLKQFLEETPLLEPASISDLYTDDSDNYNARFTLNVPTLKLYCAEETCLGYRFFSGQFRHHSYVRDGKTYEDFVVYQCNDCRKGKKTYSVAFQLRKDLAGDAVKIGEYPEIYTDVLRKLRRMLGNDYQFFVKGLKCEKQGFGIAAFAYYRRVVKVKKDQLIEEIGKVSKQVGMGQEAQAIIEKARSLSSFSASVDLIKDGIPQSLLVQGHNPLKTIHKALSDGLHEQSDQTCLELAHAIRLVLADLAERIELALSEQAELKQAMSKLHKFNSNQ